MSPSRAQDQTCIACLPQKLPRRKPATKDSCDKAITDFFVEARIQSTAVESEPFLAMVRELLQFPDFGKDYVLPSVEDMSELCAMEAERRNTIIE